jgi:hypothetical protein
MFSGQFPMTDDRTRRSGGDAGRTFTKKSGRGVSGASPPFDLSTAQVRLRGRTTVTPLTPRKTGSRRRVGQRKATELSHCSLGCRRNALPTPEDRGPPSRRYSSGSDALPSWYAVAACSPSRRGPEFNSPCLALPTVPSSGRCRSTLPQPQRHGKKKMRRFCSEFILVVKRVRPQLRDAGPRRRLSILPYNPRLLARVGLTRSMPCR